MYEHRLQPPLSRRRFLGRLVIHFGLVLVVVASLAIGAAGYVYLEGLPLADAFLHSATLLGGLGLAEVPENTEAKLFAGVYALYCGLVFIADFGIILAPVIHRVLHTFHWASGHPDAD